MVRVAFCVGHYPEPERRRRIDVALTYASKEVDIGILDIPATPYGSMGPAEIQATHSLLHKVFISAEKQGYDAVVPLGMLDLGIDGGRCLVDIPVIAPAQASLHVASLLGDRFGLISYEARLIPWHRNQVREYGMEKFVCGFRAVGMSNDKMTSNHDIMVETFLREARSLIKDEGAEVIIPFGISQCPVHIKPDWLAKELGVPVVEGIGAPIRVAAMLAALGYKQSRIRWPKTVTPG